MVLELFAGCGGASLGIREACPDVLHVGLEKDETTCRTRKAAGMLTIRADVTEYPTEPFVGKVWGLWASPPCPDFSPAGRRKGIEGESGHLIFQVPRWVHAVRPEWIACEQINDRVPLDWWRTFAEDFRELGYFTWVGVLCAADYGVPQERYRSILMASTRGPIVPPRRSHAENPVPDLFGNAPLPWVSMAEGLGWGATEEPAPTVSAGGTRTGGAEPIANGGRKRLERERAALVGYRRLRGEGMTERHGGRRDHPANEPAPTLTSKARSDELLVSSDELVGYRRHRSENWNYEGGTRPDRPARGPAPTLGTRADLDELVINTRQKSLQGGALTVDYKRTVQRPAPTLTGQAGGFWQWERPATTVCADPRIPAPGYRTGCERSLTPCVEAEEAANGRQSGTEAIKLTIRDALLLQGFPEDYPVQGSRTKQFEQVGNAVPPALAASIVDALTSWDSQSDMPTESVDG